MLMNKIYDSGFKSKELENIFNRIIIKISLTTVNKTGYPLVLGLLKEEVKRIICISVLMELNIIFYCLHTTYSKYVDSKFLIDILFKILLVSSKQKTACRLCLLKPNGFIKLKSFNLWLLKDVEITDHNLFIMILNWLKIFPVNRNSSNLIESLVENFIIKLSDVVVHELFYELVQSKVFVLHYTIDFFMFRSSFQKLRFYLYSRKVLEKIYFFSQKVHNFNYSILICTKDGFMLKSLSSNYFFGNIKINQQYHLEMINLSDSDRI